MKKKVLALIAVSATAAMLLTGCSDFKCICGCGNSVYSTYSVNSGSSHKLIKIYDKDGGFVAEYSGIIDIGTVNEEYIEFDYDGNHYVYYNCILETVTES